MNKHARITRILVATLIAAGLALASGQAAFAGPSSPGPKAASTTLKTTTR